MLFSFGKSRAIGTAKFFLPLVNRAGISGQTGHGLGLALRVVECPGYWRRFYIQHGGASTWQYVALQAFPTKLVKTSSCVESVETVQAAALATGVTCRQKIQSSICTLPLVTLMTDGAVTTERRKALDMLNLKCHPFWSHNKTPYLSSLIGPKTT